MSGLSATKNIAKTDAGTYQSFPEVFFSPGSSSKKRICRSEILFFAIIFFSPNDCGYTVQHRRLTPNFTFYIFLVEA